MAREAASHGLDLDASEPPAHLTLLQKALWHDAKGNWHAAHDAVAAESDPIAAWLHAYLHRKEGDLGNARYWYARAGRPPATGPLDAEWRDLAAAVAPQTEVDTPR